MSFDALAMHAVRDELEAAILGGFVEKVLPLGPLEIGLRIRSQHRDFNLLLSADAQSARAHLVGDTLRRLSDDVSPFLLLMRKYVREGRIVSIQQPPLERVIRLGIEAREEDGTVLISELIVEVMGRHSNVILVGADGKVLDAIKRVPPSLSRQRPVLPHMPYEPPPPVEKLNPRSPLLARQLTTAARQVPPSAPAWRFIQEAMTGLGPLGAREAVYRACGDAGCTLGQLGSVEALAAEAAGLFRLIETHQWTPCLVVQDGAVIHFAPYLLTQFPEEQLERVESISEAVERAYEEKIFTRPGEALRVPLRASIKARMDRVVRREESLRLAIKRGEKSEELKLTGQAILANVGTLEPGQKELKWEGKTISLDPKLSPADNAQRYFREYAKARDAARDIPGLLETVVHEREYLEQMAALVEVAEDEVSLRTLGRELAESERGSQGAGVWGQPAGRRKSETGSREGRTALEREGAAGGDGETVPVQRWTSDPGGRERPWERAGDLRASERRGHVAARARNPRGTRDPEAGRHRTVPPGAAGSGEVRRAVQPGTRHGEGTGGLHAAAVRKEGEGRAAWPGDIHTGEDDTGRRGSGARSRGPGARVRVRQ